jgi:hypothetical protein
LGLFALFNNWENPAPKDEGANAANEKCIAMSPDDGWADVRLGSAIEIRAAWSLKRQTCPNASEIKEAIEFTGGFCAA